LFTVVSADSAGIFPAKAAADVAGVRGGSAKEDVSDYILNIDPTETPLLSILKKGKATATTHEWLTDTLATRAENAKKEGAVWSTDSISGRTRLSNPCQIASRVYEVTGTMQAITQYGISKELAYQAVKKMKELKGDVNFDLWVNASASHGDTADLTGAARQTDGYKSMVMGQTTLLTGSTAAAITLAKLTGDTAERNFNEVLADLYTQGTKANIAFMLPNAKRQVSVWSGVSTRHFDISERTLNVVIDYYHSDFGIIQIMMDRDVPALGTDAGLTPLIYAGDFSNSKVAYLRPFQSEKIPMVKDSEAGYVLVEYANEYGHPESFGYMVGLSA